VGVKSFLGRSIARIKKEGEVGLSSKVRGVGRGGVTMGGKNCIGNFGEGRRGNFPRTLQPKRGLK